MSYKQLAKLIGDDLSCDYAKDYRKIEQPKIPKGDNMF